MHRCPLETDTEAPHRRSIAHFDAKWPHFFSRALSRSGFSGTISVELVRERNFRFTGVDASHRLLIEIEESDEIAPAGREHARKLSRVTIDVATCA
jgi:hypothetical protein